MALMPAKARELPDRSIPDKKMGSGRPSVITKHAIKVLERFLKKKPMKEPST
jgi:hypothetical protein